MKKLLSVSILFCAVAALAQTNSVGGVTIPSELMGVPLKNWQINGVTLVLIVQVLGRAFSALKNGGGLKGIWNGVVSGTNTPPEPKV